MATLFISTSRTPILDETIEYRIDRVEYANKICVRWPYAAINQVSLGGYILSWELNKENELGASGGLQANKLVVSFGSNPLEDAVDFVLWHREFVPIAQDLFLFGESLQDNLKLKPDITPESVKFAICRF